MPKLASTKLLLNLLIIRKGCYLNLQVPHQVHENVSCAHKLSKFQSAPLSKPVLAQLKRTRHTPVPPAPSDLPQLPRQHSSNSNSVLNWLFSRSQALNKCEQVDNLISEGDAIEGLDCIGL